MDICHISYRFSVTPFEFSHVRRNFCLPRSQTTPFCPRIPVASSNSLSKTDLSEPKSRNRMFILGMGFVGQFFSQALKNQGWAVSGTCTSITKKKQLEEKGFDIYLFDANQPEQSTIDLMKYHTHLLVSIPPVVGIGDPMLQHEELLRSTLMDGNLQWLGYLSSTSVYGDCGGAWVDEDYPTSPTSELANLRLVAEKGWLNLGDDLGLSAQVFRLGGIYGPGRSAVDTIIKQGALSESQKMRVSRQYTSRIHVEDISQALKASIHAPSHGKVYNIVDDDPAPREEVFAYARDLVEKKWPGQIKHSTNESESFIKKGSPRGAKRVSNARMKKKLGVRLLHPNYGSVYNIVDDDPAPREEVFAYARDLVEKKWPGQIKHSTNESESFIKKGSPRGAKRVSNARMKKKLGVRLLHPNYGSGLQSIINHMEHHETYPSSLP